MSFSRGEEHDDPKPWEYQKPSPRDLEIERERFKKEHAAIVYRRWRSLQRDLRPISPSWITEVIEKTEKEYPEFFSSGEWSTYLPIKWRPIEFNGMRVPLTRMQSPDTFEYGNYEEDFKFI